LKAAQAYQTLRPSGQLCHILSAVSLTPPTIDLRCQWHRGIFVLQCLHCFRSATDNAQLRSVATLPIKVWIRIQSKWPGSATLLGSINDTNQWSAVSLTPPTSNQRRYWHRPPQISGVIDTAHHRSAVSLILPTTGQRCHWYLPPVVSGVIDTSHQWSVVSLRLKILWQGLFTCEANTFTIKCQKVSLIWKWVS
jgi:hypothetical protein